MDLSKYAALFLTEGREHVGAMQAALRTLEAEGGGGDSVGVADAIGAMFRAAHNIKGMAATMEYAAAADVAHALETLLEGVRSGDERLTPSLVAHLFDETDALARAIEVASGTGDGDALGASPDPNVVPDSVPNAATDKAGAGALVAPGRRAFRSPYVRVETSRLDALMTSAGELEIARGRLERVAHTLGDESLDLALAQVSRVVTELRDQIVAARMVPVGHVFERFPRFVRETARALAKEADFGFDGQEIELDRSMLDEIGEPVMHLLRNALDHGIELPDARVRAGKTRRARITLSAQRESNHVLIAVADDGGGIDRARVLERARQRGVVDSSVSRLDDTELLAVLTRPGFSTTEQVTGLSGRGVGLDVVDAAVRALGGALELHSVLGWGTMVTMRVPLTVAIVQALLARVGGETFAIPVTHVLETVELDPQVVTMTETSTGGRAVMIRDQLFPLVTLREMMGFPPRAVERPKAVTVSVRGRRGALVVDDFIGQQDVVVKRFDRVYGSPALFGGATILNDGAPALIIDVNSMV